MARWVFCWSNSTSTSPAVWDALAELLEDVEGLPKDPSELYNLLKNIRYDPPALAQLLRKAQGLPQDKQALRALRQQVHDALRELERTEGSLIRATLNAGEAAGKAPDPETFLDTYSEIVHGSGSFADTFKKMLERFRPEKLRNAVELMKKALGDDLNATVAMPSRDLRASAGDPDRPLLHARFHDPARSDRQAH